MNFLLVVTLILSFEMIIGDKYQYEHPSAKIVIIKEDANLGYINVRSY
jgi:hypothetical protein